MRAASADAPDGRESEDVPSDVAGDVGAAQAEDVAVAVASEPGSETAATAVEGQPSSSAEGGVASSTLQVSETVSGDESWDVPESEFPLVPVGLAVAALGALAFRVISKRKAGTASDDDEGAPSDVSSRESAKNERRWRQEARGRLNEMAAEVKNYKVVDLQSRNLRSEGCAYVSTALAFNDVCEQLDLSKNGIGAEGAEAKSTVS